MRTLAASKPGGRLPEGHAEKAQNLLTDLRQRSNLWVTVVEWASGVVIATRR